MPQLRKRPPADGRPLEGERAHDLSGVPREHQHRYEQAGKRGRGNSEGDRESSARDHNQIFPIIADRALFVAAAICCGLFPEMNRAAAAPKSGSDACSK